MKKIITFLITLSIILSCAIIPAHASDNITVELNGREIYFDQPPIIQDDRTLVPMRAIFEAMGCEVEWYDGVIEVYQDNECIMILWIDDTEMWTLEREFFTIDVPPQIFNDRTLVPVRVISESMGADVEWNGYTQTVSITYQTNDTNNSNCNHTNTYEVCMIDLRTFEQATDTYHQLIDVMHVICEDCGETIEVYDDIRDQEHIFENGVCTACGYTQSFVLNDNLTDKNNGFVYLKDLTMKNHYSNSEDSKISVFKNGLRFSNNLTRRQTNGDEAVNYVEYDVSDYSRLTGMIKGGNSSNLGIRIYGDNNLLHKTPMISYQDEINVDIDISDYSTLRLESYGTVALYGFGRVDIQEAKLYY